MDLQVLKYFLTVVETGNVSKAAEKLHLTQPTLTRQLQRLEEDYGSTLFIRGNRHITLTNSGIILKRRAQEMLELQRKTEDEIRRSEYDIAGEITIGCGESKGNNFLPIILDAFSKQYPNIKYNIFTAGSDQNKEKVNEGLLDVAIVLEPVDTQRNQSLPLPYYDNWCVVMPKGDPLTKYKTIPNHILDRKRIALPHRHGISATFQEWLGTDIKINTVLKYDINSNITLLVERGFCYGISIDGVYQSNTHQNITYRLLEPPIRIQSYLIWKKGVMTNLALEKFIDCASEIAKESKVQKTLIP